MFKVYENGNETDFTSKPHPVILYVDDTLKQLIKNMQDGENCIAIGEWETENEVTTIQRELLAISLKNKEEKENNE